MSSRQFAFAFFISLFVSSFLILGRALPLRAAEGVIRADVALSVCGNGKVEEGEECDGLKSVTKQCNSLFFANGQVSCSTACEFDYSNCVPYVNFAGEPITISQSKIEQLEITQAAPTNSVIQATSSVQMNEQTISSASAQTDEQSKVDVPALSEETNQLLHISNVITKEKILSRYGVEQSETTAQPIWMAVVAAWSSDWKEVTDNASQVSPRVMNETVSQCDVNNDSVCSIEDISIILFLLDQ